MKRLTYPGLLLLIVFVAGAGCAAPKETIPTVAEAPAEEPAEEPVQIVNAGPQVVRMSEPEYPRAAKRKKIKAELVLNLLIDERGLVREAAILERYLIGEDPNDKQPVAELGYGLEEAAFEAAHRWRFRPAYENGQPVSSYHTIKFMFGV